MIEKGKNIMTITTFAKILEVGDKVSPKYRESLIDILKNCLREGRREEKIK